ncbi:MAG: DNA recombination protein RmuC, partial [Lentisphaeria bacterium]
QESRTEISRNFQNNREEMLKMQSQLNNTTDLKLKSIRDTIDQKFQAIQEDNGKRLDEMRHTVNEKLQESVEKRFHESFVTISERLEQVQKGLGEMQTLATGVGDLKKVLSNVKNRGTLGEIQLGAILAQCLAPKQYIQNAQTKPNSTERVEFAIMMPGKTQNDNPVLLPIDSKFPVEDYLRLQTAYENCDQKEIKNASHQLEITVKKNATDIHNKYINPPHTTDFALMFVPTEGLYAEILRQPGLFEFLQRDLKIAVVGPTNLLAFLNSLQMGFQTLAIEKRSSEVWTVLSTVKTEFRCFGDIIEKTRHRLETAVKEMDNVEVRSRAIERKLRNVHELRSGESKEEE